MTILKKAFAVLTSCALMLSLAACNSEPQETIVEKPEDISDHAIVVDYLGMAVELPTPSMTVWANRSSPPPIALLPRRASPSTDRCCSSIRVARCMTGSWNSRAPARP